MKTTLFIICFCLSFCQVFSQNSKKSRQKKDNFILLDASSENWVSGVKGGGKGTEYYLKVKISSSDKIEFDSMWVNQQSFKTYLANPGKGISGKPVTFSENDTVMVRASDIIFPNRPQIIQNSVPPKKYKGEALLRYYNNGKENYFVVKKINKTHSKDRP